MDDGGMSEEPARKSRVAMWAITIPCAIAAYILSAGPILYLEESEVLPHPRPVWLAAYFKPLSWLDKHLPLRLEVPLNNYVVWWINLSENRREFNAN